MLRAFLWQPAFIKRDNCLPLADKCFHEIYAICARSWIFGMSWKVHTAILLRWYLLELQKESSHHTQPTIWRNGSQSSLVGRFSSFHPVQGIARSSSQKNVQTTSKRWPTWKTVCCSESLTELCDEAEDRLLTLLPSVARTLSSSRAGSEIRRICDKASQACCRNHQNNTPARVPRKTHVCGRDHCKCVHRNGLQSWIKNIHCASKQHDTVQFSKRMLHLNGLWLCLFNEKPHAVVCDNFNTAFSERYQQTFALRTSLSLCGIMTSCTRTVLVSTVVMPGWTSSAKLDLLEAGVECWSVPLASSVDPTFPFWQQCNIRGSLSRVTGPLAAIRKQIFCCLIKVHQQIRKNGAGITGSRVTKWVVCELQQFSAEITSSC